MTWRAALGLVMLTGMGVLFIGYPEQVRLVAEPLPGEVTGRVRSTASDFGTVTLEPRGRTGTRRAMGMGGGRPAVAMKDG